MKTFFAFVLAVILGIALGVATASLRLAQTPWDGNPPLSDEKTSGNRPARSQRPAPKLVAEESKYDFGSMDIDEKGSHEFLVKNSGNSPITITKKESSCGCLISDPEETEIPPGETAKITIKWKSRDKLGSFSETAAFSTNNPAESEFGFKITGRFTAKLRIIPAEIVFNDISANEPTTGQARLLCYQAESLKVLEQGLEEGENASNFRVALEPLSAEQLKEEPDAKSGYLVKVTVKPGLPYGPFQQKIRLTTNIKSRPAITVPVQGTVTSDIKVVGPGWDADKGILNLGIINSKQGIRHRLLLIARGPYRKEVKFKPITNPELPLKLSLGETTEINNGVVTQTPLIIEIPQGSRSVNHIGDKPSDWGEITIETTHPEIPKVRIFVRFAIEE